MTDSGLDLEYLRKMDREHAQLAQKLEELSEALVDRKNIDLLAHRLSTTRDEVSAHFKLEEEGGYLDDAVSYAPQWIGQGQRLLDQHAELLGRIETLLKMVTSKAGRKPNWDEIEQQGHEFVSLLIEHEKEESTLIQEAYEDDLDRLE